MKTENFSEYAGFRNGVEAIPALLRRRYHVDKIPVNGKKRTRLFFGFKIAALDILVTVAFSYIVFHEKLSLKSGTGLLLIVAGTLALLI